MSKGGVFFFYRVASFSCAIDFVKNSRQIYTMTKFDSPAGLFAINLTRGPGVASKGVPLSKLTLYI